MRKRNFISKADMSAMFHCVITLKNGLHQVLRMTIDAVATIVHEFRESKKDLWNDGWTIVGGQVIRFNDIKHMSFTNERTRELFLDVE